MPNRVHTVMFREQYETSLSPCKFICSDGQTYVVKHVSNNIHRRPVINEWIGSQLAQACGIPVPPTAIIDISPDSVSVENLTFRRQIPRGVAFGSQFVLQSTTLESNLLNNRQLSKFDNAHILMRIILFDIWVHNTDRNDTRNLLIEDYNGDFKLWAIDHEKIFDEINYDRLDQQQHREYFPTLEDTLLYFDPLFSRVKTFFGIYFESAIEEAYNRIQSISSTYIAEILDSTAPEWRFLSNEKNNIAEYLRYRQGVVKTHFYDLLDQLEH